MAIKLVEIKCPNCGAVLNYEEGRKVLYCQYCGEKILLDNDHEYTYHHIDDADVKNAETDQMFKMRWLEMEEKDRQRRFKSARAILIACALLTVVGVIGISIGNEGMGLCALFAFLTGLMGFFYLYDDKKKSELNEHKSLGYIHVDKSSGEFTGKDHQYVENIMRAYGFKHISVDAMGDLTFGVFYKPGQVDSVTINGNSFGSDEWFPPNAHVCISYHSKPLE